MGVTKATPNVKRVNISLTKPACTKPDCQLFGLPHPKCTGHKRDSDPLMPCGSTPPNGYFHCKFHGPINTPSAVRAAEYRKAVSRAQALTDYDPYDGESIEDGLLREVRQASQTAMAYAAIVASLQDNELTQRTPRDGERMSAWVQAWTDERVLHARLAKIALDAGIDRRRLELEEAQAAIFVSILAQILDSPLLALTVQQRTQARIIAAQAFRDQATSTPDTSRITPRPQPRELAPGVVNASLVTPSDPSTG